MKAHEREDACNASRAAFSEVTRAERMSRIKSTANATTASRNFMHSTRFRVVLTLAASMVCAAQQWEAGAAGGYGWYINPSISNPSGSAEAGFPPKGAVGAVFGNNMYEHVGGEIRYLFRYGGPELRSGGVQSNLSGHTNLIGYDFLFHTTSRDNRLRPFLAAGAGVKVYTSTETTSVHDPLSHFAGITSLTDVEPVISGGVGVKYRFARHVLARIDFRTYFSPLPHDIFRTPAGSKIHGWVYDFVPLLGLSYVF
jgi:outer membrane protein with beta-barrel domain